MSTAASGLRELHQLLIRLREVNETLERGPKQVTARKQFTSRKLQELEAQKEVVMGLKKAIDEKNLLLRSNETKIADLKGKLNLASSNREYDIIRGQIDADAMANSVFEDEILEALEKVDRAEVNVAQLESNLATATGHEKRIEDEVAASQPGLKEEASRLKSAIAEAENPLPSAINELYRRLVHAHGADALASVDAGVCTACYMEVSPQCRVELNSGKIITCKSCSRLHYLAENG